VKKKRTLHSSVGISWRNARALDSSVAIPVSAARAVESSQTISWGPARAVTSFGTPTINLGTVQSILLQVVYTPASATESGQIIQLLEPAWTKIASLLITDPALVHQLTPRQWEEMIAATYAKAGFDEVILTPHSGDLGRDVIASKKGRGAIKIIDQVKAYKPGHNVTANDVRALLGVLQGDRNATKGVVTTTSDFAPGIKSDQSIQPFVPYRLELINGEELLQYLRALSDSHQRQSPST
jgi:restriction system protein